MKLAHLADLHLGFRAYSRETRTGMNTRESDVQDALARAVTDVIDQRPDLIVIAGDLFHSVRPTNAAILCLFQQLQRIRTAVPATRIVAVAGNHDRPRTADTTAILHLYETLGVTIAVRDVLRVRLPALDCLVTAVPDGRADRIPAPDPAVAHNVLVLHGDVPGFGAPAPEQGIDPDALARQGYEYVALGHYHICAEVKPRMWYAGSTEFTSSDPWREAREGHGKGYLLVELGQEPVFRPIATRRFLDLPPIDATGMAAAELDLRIAKSVDEATIEGAVVRLVVTGVSRDLRNAIDHQAIREYKGRALHFQLNLRRAESESTPAARAAKFHRLDDVVKSFFGERDIPPGMSREEFVQVGMEYFRTADDPYTGLPVEAERNVA